MEKMSKLEFVEKLFGDDFETQEVEKNGVMLLGIVPKISGGIRPVIYIDPFYEDYLKASEDEEENVFEKTTKEIKDAFEKSTTNFNVEELLTKDNLRKNLCIRLTKTQKSGSVAFNYVDMKMELCSSFDLGTEKGTITITGQLLDTMELTEKEALDLALENVKNSNPAVEDFYGMNVVRNETTFGASVMCDVDYLKGLYDTYGQFYILPSSKSEVIILPMDKCDSSVEELRGYVKSINDNELTAEERLSYEVYYFNGWCVSIA